MLDAMSGDAFYDDDPIDPVDPLDGDPLDGDPLNGDPLPYPHKIAAWLNGDPS